MAKPNGDALPVGGVSIKNRDAQLLDPTADERPMFVLVARSESDTTPVELSIDHLVAYLSPSEAGHLAHLLEQAATDAIHADRAARRG